MNSWLYVGIWNLELCQELKVKTLYLVYEDLELDVLVDLIGSCDCLVEFDKGLMVVVLSIYYKDECTTPTKDVLWIECWIKEVYLAREVPDLVNDNEGGGRERGIL